MAGGAGLHRVLSADRFHRVGDTHVTPMDWPQVVDDAQLAILLLAAMIIGYKVWFYQNHRDRDK